MTDKNGKHPGIQLDINAVKLADITGDLPPIAEGAGKTLGAVPTFLHRLCLLIFGDWYTDRICRDMKKRAQAEHDCEAIRQGALTLFSGQNVTEAASSIATPAQAARRHLEETGTQNLIACAAEAARILENPPPPASRSDENAPSSQTSRLSETFVNRWKNEAQFVSEHQLRHLWGAILAREITAPGSVSLKTLERLKVVSREDAEAFTALCDYVLDNDCYLAPTVFARSPDGSIQSRTRYPLKRLDVLDDLGLIHAPSAITLNERRLVPENGTIWLDYGPFTFCLKSGKDILLSMNLLKPAGKEICRIIRQISLKKAERLAHLMLACDEFRETHAIAIYGKTGKKQPDGRQELALKTVIDRETVLSPAGDEPPA